ncbi:MAG: iron uptake porin [Cyanobacteria bacterium P01_D01_bin.50]
MTKLLLNVLKLSPVAFAATLFISNGAFAAEQKFTSVDELAQVTSVDQLSDVYPSHWAFQSVKSLVERYGCVAGYPDGTFKGNRGMSRYEFAALLNGCLDRITQLIAENGNGVDMATVNKLKQEFQGELATLRGKVDGLDYRTSELEANQFSSTTKLKGEAIFAVSDVFGGEDTNAGDNFKTILSNRVRLKLSSSFNGNDKLSLRLQSRNTPKIKAAGNMSRLGFDGDNENNVEIDKLNYTFKPSKKLSVKIDAVGAEMQGNVNTFNPVFKSSGSGAISRYGRFNPVYRVANGQSAVTVKYGSKKSLLGLAAGYVANNAQDSSKGLFEGDETFFGQVEFKPSKKLNLGFAYANASKTTYVDSGSTKLDGIIGSTGSGNANKPFGTVDTNANYYSFLASYKLNKKTTLAGWYGIADASREDGTAGSADINYWAASLGIKDVGAKGNTLGVIFGQPPKVTGGSGTFNEDTNGTSYHLEGLYKMKVNDRITVTPGVLAIFNPEHDNSRDTVLVGTIRTTFKF